MFHFHLKTFVALAGVCGTVAASAQMPSAAQLGDWHGAWASTVSLADKAKDYTNQYEACCAGPAASVPLTPEYRAKREAFIKKPSSDRALTSSAVCAALGLPGVHTHPIMFEFAIEPTRTTMIYEDGEVRRIWTDGRKHPGAADLVGSPMGDSVGYWRDGALYADTTDISPKAEMFMSNGIRATPKTHIREKIYLKDKSTLVIEMTAEDSAIFTAPYNTKLGYTKVDGLFQVGCDANNRDSGGGPVDLSLPTF